MPATASVIGCGWLGLPLAAQLAGDGWPVIGSTTSPRKIALLKEQKIEPHLFSFEETTEIPAALTTADVVVVNVPPGRSDAERRSRYPSWMRKLAETVRDGSLLVFASSTSVYSDTAGNVFEEDAHPATAGSETGAMLLHTEQEIRSIRPDATILRFAGLYGYDRQPGRFFLGREDVPGGLDPVNMVHRDDAVEVLRRVVVDRVSSETLNVCTDLHPPKHQFYREWAKRMGIEPPGFRLNFVRRKRVRNDRLKSVLGYDFLHPDPLRPAP